MGLKTLAIPSETQDMTQTQPSPQEEYRLSFLRHLANRLEAVEQRIHRHRHTGWDLAGISLLHDDVQRLAGSAGRYALIVPSQRLLMLEQLLSQQLAWKRLPDPPQGDRFLAQLLSVKASLAELPEFRKSPAPTDDATIDIPGTFVDGAPGPATPNVAAAKQSALAAAYGWAPVRQVFVLSDHNAFAADICQRLKAEGFEVDAVHSIDALTGLLKGMAPELLFVDASRIDDLATAGSARCESLKRSPDKDARIRLVALAPQDNLQTRLEARRAGVDLLLFPPFNIVEVMRQVQAQLAPPEEDPVRVLIVEDDRAQALFAQSVLANAGITAQVELDALRVLDTLEGFRPDMILMDLHMPHADGMELTALIREHQAFMDIPVVFLTGENDPEARTEAINAGGDDFLTKPVGPKNLIDAVRSRVKRRRAVVRRNRRIEVRDERTGLYRRGFLFDRINDAIGTAADQGSRVGGVLFVEIEDVTALRERFGLIALERILAAAARLLAEAVGETLVAATLIDHAFVVLAPELDDAALVGLGTRLRATLTRHPFQEDGKPQRLTVEVSACPLRYGFDDASALITTVERACHEARVGDRGVRLYAPAEDSEQSPEASLARLIRDAIGGDGFGLVYQPIVAVHGAQDAQYQTLLRLRDTSGRLVPAAEILPLAERAGLMIDIDRWVLTRAMSVLAQQRDSGQGVRLFVPQALTTFAAKDQDVFLKAELAAHQLSGSSLVLECRLADALLNPPALQAFLRSMGGNGVQLCLGQYEHAADADHLLDRIRLGYLKLAPKYVIGNGPQELSSELRTLCERAHRLDIQVIGHRVEDPLTASMLQGCGVDCLQGNFVKGAGEELAFDFDAAMI
ncbi:MAG TPA: EAL domain-containing protein [Xanthomonadaceae bacterium]|jgi:PleD family two-component response regulator/EAL domain-containing protein (putative c-di-GMP-specific phosphodiesterase class I)|nr:EAL domain-containing protein [Xanthomonadaceae bacterium]